MKKVKIMLMSLALLAIVGGALAFKAKLQTTPFCTTDAYYAQSLGYYCGFQNLPLGQVTTANPTITTQCGIFLQGSTSDEFAEDLAKKVCTTTSQDVDNNSECQTLLCTSRISTIRD